MNILMVLNLPFPPDIRVEKEVKELAAAGHTVYIYASNSGSCAEVEEYIPGVIILRPHKNMVNSRAWKYLEYFMNGLFFFHVNLLPSLMSVMRGYQIDIIHVHDLRLVKTGIFLGWLFKKKVIADLHENYPAAIREYVKGSGLESVLRRKTIDGYTRWRKYEKWALEKVDKVIVVTQEAKTRLEKEYQLEQEDVIVVGNAEDTERLAAMPVKQSLCDQRKENFVLSYIGGVDDHRGVDTVLHAMQLICKEIKHVKFIIVGDGKQYGQYLLKLAKQLRVERHVEFLGWQPFELVPTFITMSDVCLVPHKASPHTETTMPHKLFQYMAFGKPVVASDCGPLKRVIQDANCGMVFKSENAEDLADKIIYLYRNRALCRELGNNGKKCAETKYSWKRDRDSLLQLYQNM